MRIEGITYEINWAKFRKGASFFIPCLNPIAARNEILSETRRLRYTVLTKITIEDGVRGVRVWRQGSMKRGSHSRP
jgi:hypothetical protein